MANQYPPGWYPDAQGVTRWWDGTQWTEHTQPAQGAQQGAQQQAAAPPYGAPPPAGASAARPFLLAAMAAALIAVIGSVGEWASGPLVATGSTTGTEGGDGYIVIFCVLIAAALLWIGNATVKRWPFVTACVLAALSLLVGVIDYSDITDKAQDVSWGLVLVLIGSLALAVLSLVAMARRRGAASGT